jgi:hypothetical protein
MNPHLKPIETYYEDQDWEAGVEAEEEMDMC